MANEIEKNNGEIIIYQSEDGKIRLDVRLENNTVWLSQEQIALLFSKGRTTITEHISNIFKEGELDREKVCRKIRHTTQHGALVRAMGKNCSTQSIITRCKYYVQFTTEEAFEDAAKSYGGLK